MYDEINIVGHQFLCLLDVQHTPSSWMSIRFQVILGLTIQCKHINSFLFPHVFWWFTWYTHCQAFPSSQFFNFKLKDKKYLDSQIVRKVNILENNYMSFEDAVLRFPSKSSCKDKNHPYTNCYFLPTATREPQTSLYRMSSELRLKIPPQCCRMQINLHAESCDQIFFYPKNTCAKNRAVQNN